MKTQRFPFFVRTRCIGLVLLSVTVLAFVVSACGGSSSSSSKPSTSNAPASTGSSVKVMIMEVQGGAGDQYSFDPANVTIKVGTTVVWTNMTDQSQFLASDTPGIFGDSSKVEGNNTFQMTFSTPGMYTYYSKKIPDAKGTIMVTS